ncbi:MAG: response regulator [Ignavibacteriales bacterium]|nr:response regulator [Ignavibacteriales bacterium]MCF8305288.1 response regulator [Ignavibacteriales bacterium]MCF8314799.1 response regulator [Ignavibacteriales bacterium]MCF8436252.1 response regulator [Ignavibacteriales bacterium]
MAAKKDILIIDDEQVVIEGAGKILSAYGYSFEGALNAESAFSLLKKKNIYRLILSDIKLPDKDGFQILEKLTAEDITIPVIMITGFSTMEYAVKALQFGAIDFLPKPFTVEEIISKVMRGLAYSDIRTKYLAQQENPVFDSEIFFVPTPSQYASLGNISWAFETGDGVFNIGMTDVFLKTIGQPESLELKKEGEQIFQGSPCLIISAGEEIEHELLAPFSGKIIEVNKKLVNDTTLLEKDPYFDGWIYKIIPQNPETEMQILSGFTSYVI